MLVKPSQTRQAGHILSIEGPQGTGKTDLALRGPKKMGLQSSEGGWRRAIGRQGDAAFIDENYLMADYYLKASLDADELFADGDREESKRAAEKQMKEVNDNLWKPFKQDYAKLMADPTYRGVVWDFADEFNDIARLVHFGKMEKNPQIASGPINLEFKNLIKEARKNNKMLILIHQIGAKYKTVVDPDSGREKSVMDGDKKKRRGNESVHYLIDSYVSTRFIPPVLNKDGTVKEEGKFMVDLIYPKLNPQAMGTSLENPEFATMMQMLAPDVDPEVWL